MLPASADLEYFLEVAQTKNISRAAERLGITQPSLSLSIKRLEEALGSQLLLRTKTGVRLTPQGLRFQSHARHLLDEWIKIKAEALNLDTEIRGHFTIGCHPSVAMYSVPHFLPKILKANGELEIHLKHDLSRKITEDVISFNADFGIVVNPVQHPDLVIKELFKDEVSLWICQKPSDLQNPESDEAVIIYDPHLIQSQAINKKLKKAGRKFKREIQSNNLEVITALIAAKTGIGVLPHRVARRIKSQKLTPLPGESPVFQDKICLVYRADAPKTAASRYIVDEILKSVHNMG